MPPGPFNGNTAADFLLCLLPEFGQIWSESVRWVRLVQETVNLLSVEGGNQEGAILGTDQQLAPPPALGQFIFLGVRDRQQQSIYAAGQIDSYNKLHCFNQGHSVRTCFMWRNGIFKDTHKSLSRVSRIGSEKLPHGSKNRLPKHLCAILVQSLASDFEGVKSNYNFLSIINSLTSKCKVLWPGLKAVFSVRKIYFCSQTAKTLICFKFILQPLNTASYKDIRNVITIKVTNADV